MNEHLKKKRLAWIDGLFILPILLALLFVFAEIDSKKSSDIKKLKHIFTILSFCLIGTSGVLLIFFAFFQTDSTENYTISVMRNEFIIPEILDNKTGIKEKKTTEWRIQHQYATLTISPTEINALLAHNSPMKSCSSSDCKMLNWYKIRPTSGNYFSEENVGTENIVCAKKI